VRASRLQTIQVLACIIFAGLALRPVPELELLLDRVLLSSRPIAALAWPLSGAGIVHAGDDREAELLARQELDERVALELAVRRSAEPVEDYESDTHPVHAEVVGRSRGALDVLEVRVDRVGLVEIGQPVIAGENYVGRVSRVTLKLRNGVRVEDVEVSMVTGRRARIGARVVDSVSGEELARAVVGGLLPSPEFGLPDSRQVLCMHFPSRRSLRSGLILVDEPPGGTPGSEDLGYLANGFRLGLVTVSVNPDERTRERLLGVETELDYATGLYQVLILTKPRDSEAPDAEEEDIWAPARLALRAGAGLGREGRKLLRGRSGGVLPGAALASGVRLYGRVESSGLWTSDVRGLGDPGLSLPALAVLEGEADARLHVLGQLVALGRNSDGQLRFLWEASVPLEGTEDIQARVWSGSGEAGLPRGLLLGDTLLPVGSGPHELLIEPPFGGVEPEYLNVRLAERLAKPAPNWELAR
jgi:hypothetical protein